VCSKISQSLFRVLLVPGILQVKMLIMNKNRIITFAAVLLVMLSKTEARQITDMAGRRVTIPDKITRVISYDNKTNVMLFPVAGDLMIAKARAMESPDLKYITKSYLQLHEIDTKNAEEVLKLKPDLIVVAAFIDDGESLSQYTAFSEKTKIPLVVVDLSLMKLDRSFEFLGVLLNKSAEVKKFADFIGSVYSDAAKIKSTQKIQAKAYLANDNDGLRTAPDKSRHSQLFSVMGITNVAVAPTDMKGFSIVSMEQLFVWNPEYIFCIGKAENSPYRTILKSAMWQGINAVKNKKVYYVPCEPYIWFDMPPSINRLPGIIWISEIFYNQSPDLTKNRIKEFYSLFYNYNLTDKEYDNLFKWQ
jgi:iron complex transport system substrate-binding protein